LGEVAGAASARGASTRAAASAWEEEEKSIFQRVTRVEMWICKEKEWLEASIYEFERSSGLIAFPVVKLQRQCKCSWPHHLQGSTATRVACLTIVV
jgi:hypothetical protein